MIRLLVKKYLDDKCFRDRKKITLNDVSEQTGISRATLNRIVNIPDFKTNTDAINRLCKFLECTPCELIEYIPDEDEETKEGSAELQHTDNNKEN